MDHPIAWKVPLGMFSPGFCSMPEMLAPAMKDRTAGKKIPHTDTKLQHSPGDPSYLFVWVVGWIDG